MSSPICVTYEGTSCRVCVRRTASLHAQTAPRHSGGRSRTRAPTRVGRSRRTAPSACPGVMPPRGDQDSHDPVTFL